MNKIQNQEDERLYALNYPNIKSDEIVYLKKYEFDKEFEEGYDPSVNAELLLNYQNKLHKINVLKKFYEHAIDSITKDLPNGMILYSSTGEKFKIQNKYSDKELVPYITEDPTINCGE